MNDYDNIHEHPSSAEYALINAAQRGDINAMRSALAAGAHPAVRFNIFTPLGLAASAGSMECVAFLLDSGAMADHGRHLFIKDSFGSGVSNPLVCAATAKSVACIDLLASRGLRADFRPGDHQPIMAAAASGSVRVVRAMLRAGGDPNGGWDTGRTALIYGLTATDVSQENRLGVARLLIHAGARFQDPRPEGLAGRQWDAPLAVAITSKAPLCALFLLEQGADPNQLNRDGMSALMLALSFKQTELVAALLAKGAKVDHDSNGGREGVSAMELCAQLGFVDGALHLVRSGCDPTGPGITEAARKAEQKRFLHALSHELLATWEKIELSTPLDVSSTAKARLRI